MGADAHVDDKTAAPWSCTGQLYLALVEVANFAALRRALGVGRAVGLPSGLAAQIAAALPAATIAIAGRLIELWMHDERSAAAVAEAIHAVVATPVDVDGQSLMVELSVGVVAVSGHENEIAALEAAETALAAARPDPSTPRPSPPSAISDEEALTARELRAAIDEGELFLHYQPKLHLRRQQIASVEALIRWQHPRRGLIMPNDFITLAERSSDIAALTLWTMRQVIADQATMRRDGHDLRVFINMAGVLLSDARFVDQVIALVEPSGAALGIEITETSVIRDPSGAIHHLQRLADIGVAITIDDYGAGLSSLAYLKQLPASELKIDKLFVTQLTSSHRDPLIVRSTIDLAHALEMEVVAEGVETATSMALLSVMGCDMVQGYLISRPLALDALLAFLHREDHLAVATAPRNPFKRLAAVRARA